MITGIPLSVSAAIGFIALFGQAVLNGVVVVTCCNQLREQAMDLTNLRPYMSLNFDPTDALVATVGSKDGEGFIRATGFTATVEFPRWFVRVAWIPKQNFGPDDVPRVGAG